MACVFVGAGVDAANAFEEEEGAVTCVFAGAGGGAACAFAGGGRNGGERGTCAVRLLRFVEVGTPSSAPGRYTAGSGYEREFSGWLRESWKRRLRPRSQPHDSEFDPISAIVRADESMIYSKVL